MQAITEFELRYFQAWSGAKHTLKTLIEKDDVDEIEEYLIGYMNELDKPWTETQLNDYLWFDCDQIAEILGYDTWENYCNEKRRP